MKNSQINFGKALLQTLNLLILKLFTLPFKIYKNSLINLSNSESQDSAESTLSDDFPLYVWQVSIFDALIFLAYPIGIIVFLSAVLLNTMFFEEALLILVASYFYPLIIGLLKEIYSIALKNLQYLKTISKK